MCLFQKAYNTLHMAFINKLYPFVSFVTQALHLQINYYFTKICRERAEF